MDQMCLLWDSLWYIHADVILLSICMCILHIVFCTVCKYVLSICKLFLSGARSQEFLTKAHVLWSCDNKSDLIFLIPSRLYVRVQWLYIRVQWLYSYSTPQPSISSYS